MSRRLAGRARHGALAAATVAAVTAAALAAATDGTGQGAPAPAGPLPALGVADPATTLIGAAPAGAPGEAWGYRELPPTVGAIDGGAIALAPVPDPSQPAPQLVFLRHTDATGWRIAATPRDESGAPYRGMIPNRRSARTTPNGGVVLAGRDTTRPVGSQAVILRRDPGGPFELAPAPPVGVLAPGEALAATQGTGRIAIAAFEHGDATGIYLAPAATGVNDGVLRFDANGWTREAVEPPAGSESGFWIVALDAVAEDDAWGLAVADPALGRGIVLMRRTVTPDGPLWVERDVGATPFADRDVPALGLVGLEPLQGAAQSLTATTGGVWVDAEATIDGAARDLTLYFDETAGTVTGSWCDAPACAAPLGARFSRQAGYRSFAWPGPGFGTRVITNPLDLGGAEDSNRGSYLRLADGAFLRLPGGGGNFRPSGAFASADEGWLEGPTQISAQQPPDRLRAWPVALRAPLAAVAPEPGKPVAALGSGALAVGAGGSVARYVPGRGWRREFLLSPSGSVVAATLRGVAWPEPARSHAVGDRGAMWQWNADDGLWTADPGIPIGFEGHLLDVAFAPGDPDRGYAVGKGGVLLAYGKSWEPEALPAGHAGADLTSIAFAGSQAIVAAGGDLLVNDGGAWRVDASAKALLDTVRAARPQLVAVAGLPDGGAIAAGRDIILVRERAGAPWRFADQPLPGATAIAAAAFRDDSGALRAVVSVLPALPYPPADDLPDPDPNVPPPIPPPFQLPGDGYLLRQTGDGGWRDEQRSAFAGTGADRPIKSDPVLALLLDAAGSGWAVGGWSGDADSAGRGTSVRGSTGSSIRERVRTAGVYRYGSDAAAPAARAAPIPLPAGPARLAIAGHAQCDGPCADLAPHAIGPDRTLAAALRTAGALAAAPHGPRAMLYTGNRARAGLTSADARRYAQLLAAHGGPAVFPALGSGDAPSAGAAAFGMAFAGFPAPLGSGPAPAGIELDGIPGAPAGPGARTHYAFDTVAPGGRVRVAVIDNSLGSLATSDPHQNPAEPQLPWLIAVLDDARSRDIPAVVVGNRDLNTRFAPRLNVATDGDQVARVLVEHGASAYFHDRPEENRATRIPAAGAVTIPSFGTGTLGYRSPLSGVFGVDAPDSLFGDSGILMAEIDVARRDATTNRAPVAVRMIPVIEDLSLEATDGTLLRRSRPALFRGLGRRPRGGDRWGRASAGTGTPDPSGGNPYTSFPPDQCLVAGCSARIAPEYAFASSDPDIADFVAQDTESSNLRKPLLDADDKPVSSSSSGLLCAFNAGTTTVTVSAGGYSYSEQVTVLGGSVQRPCGTRPLDPGRFARSQPGAAPPAPPPIGPSPAGPPLGFDPPPLVPLVPPVTALAPSPPTPPPPIPPAVVAAPFLAAAVGVAGTLPAVPPPPPPPTVRPLPPGGAPARTFQVEERREEEVATEESHAFARYSARDSVPPVPLYLPALVLLAALAGAGLRRGGPGTRARVRPVPAPARAADSAPDPARAAARNDPTRRSRQR